VPGGLAVMEGPWVNQSEPEIKASERRPAVRKNSKHARPNRTEPANCRRVVFVSPLTYICDFPRKTHHLNPSNHRRFDKILRTNLLLLLLLLMLLLTLLTLLLVPLINFEPKPPSSAKVCRVLRTWLYYTSQVKNHSQLNRSCAGYFSATSAVISLKGRGEREPTLKRYPKAHRVKGPGCSCGGPSESVP